MFAGAAPIAGGAILATALAHVPAGAKTAGAFSLAHTTGTTADLDTLPALTGGIGEPLSGESDAFQSALAAYHLLCRESDAVSDGPLQYGVARDVYSRRQEAAIVLAKIPAATMAGMVAKARIIIRGETIAEFESQYICDDGCDDDVLIPSIVRDMILIAGKTAA
jgi:hypothetical protein